LRFQIFDFRIGIGNWQVPTADCCLKTPLLPIAYPASWLLREIDPPGQFLSLAPLLPDLN